MVRHADRFISHNSTVPQFSLQRWQGFGARWQYDALGGSEKIVSDSDSNMLCHIHEHISYQPQWYSAPIQPTEVAGLWGSLVLWCFGWLTKNSQWRWHAHLCDRERDRLYKLSATTTRCPNPASYIMHMARKSRLAYPTLIPRPWPWVCDCDHESVAVNMTGSRGCQPR
jgi:hypothetical protein